jgi:hypothetical protein
MSSLILLIVVVFTALAVVCDVVSYRSHAQPRKGYRPNLPLLGIGVLGGLCISLVYLLGYAIEKFFAGDTLGAASLWQKIMLLLIPSILLALVVLAFRRLCHPD